MPRRPPRPPSDGRSLLHGESRPGPRLHGRGKGGSARALGTQFIAQDQADGAVITVTQHRVRVSFKGDHGDIAEGQRLSYDARHGLSAPESIDVADADAWTRGRLVAVNRPLGDIVAEISRYHSGYVHVAPEIAAMPVSGNFGHRTRSRRWIRSAKHWAFLQAHDQ
jgi:ferric-dicitrate binding protein FerR (iron transport regulator)